MLFITETEQESLSTVSGKKRIVVYADQTGVIYAIFRVPAVQMKDAYLNEGVKQSSSQR